MCFCSIWLQDHVFAWGNDNLWILRQAKKWIILWWKYVTLFPPQETYGAFACVFRNIFLRAGSEDKNKTYKCYVFNGIFFFYLLNKNQFKEHHFYVLLKQTILKNNILFLHCFFFLCFSKIKNQAGSYFLLPPSHNKWLNLYFCILISLKVCNVLVLFTSF